MIHEDAADLAGPAHTICVSTGQGICLGELDQCTVSFALNKESVGKPELSAPPRGSIAKRCKRISQCEITRRRRCCSSLCSEAVRHSERQICLGWARHLPATRDNE